MSPPHADVDLDAELSGIREKKRREAEAAGAAAKPNWSAFAKPAAPTWPKMDAAAFHGVAGEVTRMIEPHSEADPVAILLQFLVCTGNVIGRVPYYQVESDRHHVNLFAALVGTTAKARKGTSMGRIRAIMEIGDERWNSDRVKGGLSSGEGLTNEVRDLETDSGIADKRLLVVEPELAGALSVMERHGNTLSPVIRNEWDGNKLGILTKNSPITATDAHISIVAHITEDELKSRIARTDLANGFANRFLFALIKRSKELPFGGNLTDSEILHLGTQVGQIIEGANLFHEAACAAGVKKSAHGVRKIGATRAAENGATVAELEAIFGWQGGGMASLYTRAADRARLAKLAMKKLERTPSEQSIPSPDDKVRDASGKN
jgi:hypothetical protein